MSVLISQVLEEQKEREKKSRNLVMIGMDDPGEQSLGMAASPNVDKCNPLNNFSIYLCNAEFGGKERIVSLFARQ